MRHLSRVAAALMLVAGLLLTTALSARPHTSHAASTLSASPTNQLIVSFKDLKSASALTQVQLGDRMTTLSALAGTTLSYARPMSGGQHVLRLPAALPIDQVEQIAARLRASANIERAEPDYMRQAADAPARLSTGTPPNDPLYAQQWNDGPAASWGANLQGAWEITTGDPKLTIAVIDTGIRPDHPDLVGRTVPGVGYDFISDAPTARDGDGRDDDPSDEGDWNLSGDCGGASAHSSSWHGTHVAGIIGAAGNNSVGVAGINWRSKLLILRGLGRCGGFDSDIIDAMRWAVGIAVPGVPDNAYPARVINMSLGGFSYSCPTTYQSAIDDAVAKGAVVVVAAGNSQSNATYFMPANCQNVVVVGATGPSGERASYSNYGSSLDLSAPGGTLSSGVLSTLNGGATTPGSNGYGYLAGTSMAAPHVSGVASLILSVNSSLTPSQVESLLKDNLTSFPGSSDCALNIYDCGDGILNAAAAVQATAPLFAIASGDPPGGLRGILYSFQFSATGNPSASFAITSGTLPPGLKLSAEGLLAGTPTKIGQWQFTVEATGSLGATDSRSATIAVSEPLPPYFVPLSLS